ncbi:MAG TPA: NAD(P)/FAD-dependent oxidoreductase [Solirubrobacteraceae bacterium]|jgi:2-polyprenyl-6-methoxyphenol hydroxylase-like FAD-dependent oxidoreductase|nr:NAD(P)/FAD-dependent oxidoreductase [Solirubrobacteraceae bacterium]
MSGPERLRETPSAICDYDAAIVGASLAGCTAAILLARAGARVALVEQRPDAAAFKRICSHFIQSSAVPTLERLGLLGAIEEAGGLRVHARAWTRWGWIEASTESCVPRGVNLRRELLDPMIRRKAAETPGVELILGHTAHALIHDGDDIRGVEVRERGGRSRRLRARLVVGADGRGSRVAKLAWVATRTIDHGRFFYAAYFEGPSLVGAPDGSAWFLDPDWAAALPTDNGLTLYAAMPTKKRQDEFRRDPIPALVSYVAALPDAPPILASRMVGRAVAKIDIPNVVHAPTAPGLALVGDAALATDPLWAVGCGWALQSGEWLADSVARALLGAEPLQRALQRYSRRHSRGLDGHAAMIHDYTTGRKFNAIERALFSCAARDERLTLTFTAMATRNITPTRALTAALPRVATLSARESIARRVGIRSRRTHVENI